MGVPPVTWIFCCCSFAFFVLTLIRSEVRVPAAFEEDEPVEGCCANADRDGKLPFRGCRAVCGLSEATPLGSISVGVGT